MVLGKLVFRGERKKFFLYGENKKKKEISYEKAEKKKRAGGVAYVRTFFIFLVSKLDNKTNKK